MFPNLNHLLKQMSVFSKKKKKEWMKEYSESLVILALWPPFGVGLRGGLQTYFSHIYTRQTSCWGVKVVSTDSSGLCPLLTRPNPWIITSTAKVNTDAIPFRPPVWRAQTQLKPGWSKACGISSSQRASVYCGIQHSSGLSVANLCFGNVRFRKCSLGPQAAVFDS